jgi:hypothetical protein
MEGEEALNDDNMVQPMITEASYSAPAGLGAIVCSSRSVSPVTEVESRAKKLQHSRAGTQVAVMQVESESHEQDAVPVLHTITRIPKIKKKRSNVDIPSVTITQVPSTRHDNNTGNSSILLQECYIDHVDPYDESGTRKPLPVISSGQTSWSDKVLHFFKKSKNHEYSPLHLQDHYPKYYDCSEKQSSWMSLFTKNETQYEPVATHKSRTCHRLVWIILLLFIIILLCPLVLVILSQPHQTETESMTQ